MHLHCVFEVLKKNLLLTMLPPSSFTSFVFPMSCSATCCTWPDATHSYYLSAIVTDLHTDIVPKMLEDIKRPSRSFGIPKLRGLCHSDPDASRGKFRILSKSRSGITATRGARSGYVRFDEAAHAFVDTTPWHSDDGWYDSNGQVLAGVYDDGMAACLLQERDGIIAFDAVFC